MRLKTKGRQCCSWCGQETTKICCGKCEDVWYCCKDHQKEDWDDHSHSCKAYKVKFSSDAGQYVTASRKIKAGAVVLTDVPVAIGPMGTSDLICLGCHCPIEQEDFYKCPDCKWPMCSIQCSRKKCHDAECDILSRDVKQCGAPQSTGPTPRYDLILLLRVLLLKTTNPHLWSIVMSMASHGNKKMMEGDLYQLAAVRYLKEVCKVDFDEEIIHFVRGVILTNVIRINSPGGSCLRALYPDIRLMNHSCKPNMQLSTNAEGIMEARATVNIEKGKELTISYTEIDVPIWERRSCLLSAHYFSCACERCVDPSECDTWFSSCRCPQCPSVILKPIRKLDTTLWYCRDCKTETSDEEVAQEVNEWIFRLEMNDLFGSGTPFKISGALVLVERHFHKKHYVYLKACQLSLRKLAFNDSMSAFKLRKQIWEQLLDLFNHFEPGLTRRRGVHKKSLDDKPHIIKMGMILNELAKINFNMTKLSSAKEELSEEQIRNLLLTSHSLHAESYQILKLEPRGTQGWTICLAIPKQLEDISRDIESIRVQ